MKIIIEESDQCDGIEIIIKCKRIDDDVSAIMARLKSEGGKILGTIDDKTYILNEKNILYFESVDKKCFIYTKDKVYETALRLYEIEEILNSVDFLRISKQSIVNIRKIKSVSPAGNSRFQALLTNGERLIISRQYVPALKERFGL